MQIRHPLQPIKTLNMIKGKIHTIKTTENMRWVGNNSCKHYLRDVLVCMYWPSIYCFAHCILKKYKDFTRKDFRNSNPRANCDLLHWLWQQYRPIRLLHLQWFLKDQILNFLVLVSISCLSPLFESLQNFYFLLASYLLSGLDFHSPVGLPDWTLQTQCKHRCYSPPTCDVAVHPFFIHLIVCGGSAPASPITHALSSASSIGLPLVDEREDTRWALSIGIWS